MISLFVFTAVLLAILDNSSVIESKPTTNRTRLYDSHTEFEPKLCMVLPPTVLSDVLGPAYNSRYMSIENPIEDGVNGNEESYNKYVVQSSPTSKRKTNSYRPFYVDDTYVSQISDRPAWEVKHSMAQTSRDKREASDDENWSDNRNGEKLRPNRNLNSRNGAPLPPRGERPWKCEAQIKWLDLGSDYFPRYLRTVECTKHFCWYGHYACRPRSFTVKILRRRNGECVSSENLHKIGVEGIPGELRELWIWEERAVNFCCDCALP